VWGKARSAAQAMPGTDDDILAELDRLRRRSTMSRRAVLGGGAATAAAAIYCSVNPPLGLWPSLAELSADYRTQTGEQKDVTIAGGVEIRLNTQTSRSVQASEGASHRVRLVAGEASFVLPSDGARSLTVRAGSGQTVVQSGRFDIRMFGQSGAAPVSVSCLEGSGRIELGAQSADLRPGHRVRYENGAISPATTIDAASVSDWQRGIVEFRGMPLAEAVDEINRYRPGRIILANNALGAKQLSGRFRIDQMNMVLVQLEQAFSAKVQRLPGGIVILS
jgi:transmembrane sensor